MRRADKQITDLNEIFKIIEECKVCRLGLSFENFPYIVPMNFGYENINDKIILYFHCAKDGKKIDIIKKNPSVCFEMDTKYKLVEGDKACGYGFKYKSIIGFGTAEFIVITEEKKKALNIIMKKYTNKNNYNFDDKILNLTTVFKIESSDYTAKGR